MEKKTPHTALAKIKALVQAGKVNTTKNALATAKLALGNQITSNTLVNIILGLNRSDFYKAMTDDYDHTVWHEVYRPKTVTGVELYVKLIIQDDVLIVSFKEK